MAIRSYRRIDQVWTDTSHVLLYYPDGTELARIPMTYLEHSGTNDWQLVRDIAQALLEESIVLTDAHGMNVQLHESTTSGSYFVRNAEDPQKALTPKTGPEGKRAFIPLEDSSQSTVSKSSRSTARQTNFRIGLASRDSKCVVTGDSWQACIASHIVPFSRLDVYKRIYISSIAESNLFEPSMGILLSDSFSRLFDRFLWSIYVRDGRYVLHGPALPDDFLQHHGKKLAIADGREWNPKEMPEPIFCQWHWEQCMQAHVRGMAIWPSMESIAQGTIERGQSSRKRSRSPRRTRSRRGNQTRRRNPRARAGPRR